MSQVMAIVRRDLLGYIAAPKAAAVFWFFLLFLGFFFFSFVHSLAEDVRRAAQMGGNAATLDQLIRALFNNIHFILLLVVPAVTMGSFAEEKRLSSFKLLQSSPVSTFKIVMGKFLAVAVMMFLVILCSAVFPLFTVWYGNPDKGVILSAYLGLTLLVFSQLSLGLWISSMAKNQFIAFILTMFGLFLLMILNWIAPNLSSGESASEIVKYLASTTHFDNFLKGQITISDTVYFLSFSGLFLFFTHVVVDSFRWR